MYIVRFNLRQVHFKLFRARNLVKHAVRKKKPAVRSSEPAVRSTKPAVRSLEPVAAARLDPLSIPKFLSQLVKPPVYKPRLVKLTKRVNGRKHYEKIPSYSVDIREFKQQILPKGFPATTVRGYGGLIRDPATGRTTYSKSSPGATFEAVRGVPVMVRWINRLRGQNPFAVDPTLHWANPDNMPMDPPEPWPIFPPGFPYAQRPVPVVTHLHGGEVPSVYDGHPDAWFTYDGKKGPAYETNRYIYPNKQEPATLWYHDHALGITRLNVNAGLAGFYLLRDPGDRRYSNVNGQKIELPHGKYEIPLVIQDRSFNTDGTFSFNDVGVNPEVHPYWAPEFFGDTIMVNGKVWPNLKVERRQYRFRILNGSNARFYNLQLPNGMKFTQIGSDGGFLSKSVELETLLLAPAERADILIDFSDITPGTSLVLSNDANAPYPSGDAPDPLTVGQIMQFTVPANAPAPVKPVELPEKLNDIPKLEPDSPGRTFTLYEAPGPNGPLTVLLNGQKWSAPISELPIAGSTEQWAIANLTTDAHPIHLHLIQFQIVNRQYFNVVEYKRKWEKVNGIPPLDHPSVRVPLKPFLYGNPIDPDENEGGWKDTIRMNPGQVTRIRVRFAPQDIPVELSKPGTNFFPFDPTLGPGYVWHCHILDHEDNEMMRPYKVVK